ncbi:MAG: coenzyme F420-0:L-glutamate ligase [Christensenellales bacterium]|jgi:hypothetical protein
MARYVGTVSRGIRAPIIREGDDIAEIVADSVVNAAEGEGFSLHEKDVVAVTEAVVARAQGNYATTAQIAEDISAKFGNHPVGVVFPILSRNRFSICLKGIAMGAKKVVLMLAYPADEVGNHLISLEALDAANVNPYSDVLDEATFIKLFGRVEHMFTGVDYIALYRRIVEEAGCECEIVFANDCRAILRYTGHVLACDIHSRARTRRLLQSAGAKTVYGLEDILTSPVSGSGYNEEYGLLGTNKASEDRVKLFPRDCTETAERIAQRIFEKCGVKPHAMIYGDGAFKDPVGKIWELADPVVCPGHTDGLKGQPNELKLKYLADNDFADLSGDALKEAISESIRNKDANLKGSMASEGTTPRRIVDLIGSLSDLTSGSGDKGTPIVLVQGYFDNFTTEY